MSTQLNHFFTIFFEKPKSFPEALFLALRIMFLFVFFVIFLNVCCFNSSSMFQFNLPLAAVIAGAMFILLLYAIYKIKKYTTLKFQCTVRKYSSLIAIVGLFFVFVLQILEAHAIYRPIGWDCGTIVDCAVKGDLTSQRFYFSTYPNNLLLYCFLKNLLKVFFYFGGTNYWLFLSIINIILIDLAIFLVFLVCKKLMGLSCGFTAYTLFIFLFGLSPWIVVPYSDTLSMFFIPLILLLFLYFQSSKKMLWKGIFLFLIGFITIVGYYMKPYVSVVTIAMLIYLLVQNSNSIKKFAVFLLSAVILTSGSVCSAFVYNATIKQPYAKVLDYSAALPMSYYFMMGLNTAVSQGTGKTLYGAYSSSDNLFAYSLPTPQEKKSETLRVAFSRIKSYTPAGYAEFLFNKVNWVFSDGTFWVEGEGTDVDQPSVSTSGFSQGVQSFFRFYGNNYSYTANFIQGIWLLLLFLLICPLFSGSGDFKKSIVNILRILILGFVLYQMLFEARSRYIIAVLPAIVMLAACGFSNLHENFYSYPEHGLQRKQDPPPL